MKTEKEQKMSDTPETDAVCSVYNCIEFLMVDSDFARKLERERDEARRERDEALAEIKGIQESHDITK